MPFLYFDLGNVLFFFSHERMALQIAQVLNADPELVRRALFADGLAERHETGEIDGHGLHAALCERFGVTCDYDRFFQAASDIFWINASILPVVAYLSEAGYRLGVLSNINDMHWQFLLSKRAGLIPSVFDAVTLSYEVGAMKPAPAIYEAAAQNAGVSPQEIFYTDDVAGHVEGANAAGFDAVQYTGTPALVAELRKRGLEFNY